MTLTKMTTATETVEVSDEIIEALAHESLYGFFTVCLPHYLQLPSAPFHRTLADTIESPDYPLLEIIGFRDSAKSTYATLAFVLYAALTKKYKFIVVINDTNEQVKLTIANIRYEIENNAFIRAIFGRFTIGATWSDTNLLLSNGVRIIGRSRGTNIRGIRHRESRPDLIVVDDPENLQQVQKKESRDKTERWFNGEVLPARAAFNCKLLVIGNFLHNDGFISRLSRNTQFHVLRIPVYDPVTKLIAWSAKYPDMDAIRRKRKEVGETAWAREYLLKVIAEDDQIVKESDIQRYPNSLLTSRDENGELAFKILDAGVGGDLAISEKQTADYTAFVSGYKIQWGKDLKKIIILPNPVKRRMDFHKTQESALGIAEKMPHGTKFYIEDVGYQRAALQGLSKKGVAVFPMRPVTDKRARLQSVAPFILDGTVLFPETGCEDLIQSLVNFGVEEHDDDLDALVYLIMGLVNKSKTRGVAKIDKLG